MSKLLGRLHSDTFPDYFLKYLSIVILIVGIVHYKCLSVDIPKSLSVDIPYFKCLSVNGVDIPILNFDYKYLVGDYH